MDKINFNYKGLIENGTGSHDEKDIYKINIIKFDIYEVKVKLSLTNEFISIEEVKVNKDFLSYKQKFDSIGVIDFDDIEY